MNPTPWFHIGKDGPPLRNGMYQFKLSLPEATITCMALYRVDGSFVITEDCRLIGLTYEDHWRGVLE